VTYCEDARSKEKTIFGKYRREMGERRGFGVIVDFRDGRRRNSGRTNGKSLLTSLRNHGESSGKVKSNKGGEDKAVSLK